MKEIKCQTIEELLDQPMSVEECKAVLEHMKKFKVKPMISKDDYIYVNDVFDNIVCNAYGKEVNFLYIISLINN